MLMLNVTHKLRKVLQREGKGYQSELQRCLGVGLTDVDFALCVNLLVVEGWCTLSKGKKDAPILTFNEAYKNTKIFTPAEVIADAMKQQEQ